MPVKNMCSNTLPDWGHSPQIFEVVRPEEASQNGAEGGMAAEDIKKWKGHFDS